MPVDPTVVADPTWLGYLKDGVVGLILGIVARVHKRADRQDQMLNQHEKDIAVMKNGMISKDDLHERLREQTGDIAKIIEDKVKPILIETQNNKDRMDNLEKRHQGFMGINDINR